MKTIISACKKVYEIMEICTIKDTVYYFVIFITE